MLQVSKDDEIVAFLHRFDIDECQATFLLSRMREVGVLRELAGEWSPPPFLVDFIEKLGERHALASPKVIQGWIVSILNHLAKLNVIIESGKIGIKPELLKRFNNQVELIADILHTIVGTVEEDCDHIGSEVAQYRPSKG